MTRGPHRRSQHPLGFMGRRRPWSSWMWLMGCCLNGIQHMKHRDAIHARSTHHSLATPWEASPRLLPCSLPFEPALLFPAKQTAGVKEDCEQLIPTP